MTTKFESGSVVTDNTLQFMKPAVEDNAKVELGAVIYHYSQYIENGGYACNENYWAPLYADDSGDPEFESDKDAVEHLNYLKEKYPGRKIKLIIHKRLDTREVVE
jgi:hypothetical protein